MPAMTNRKLTLAQVQRARELRNRNIPLPYSRIKQLLNVSICIQCLSRAVRNPNYATGKNRSGNIRLTREQVVQIRNMVKYSGYSRYAKGRYKFIRTVAEHFQTSPQHIYDITTFRDWR